MSVCTGLASTDQEGVNERLTVCAKTLIFTVGDDEGSFEQRVSHGHFGK